MAQETFLDRMKFNPLVYQRNDADLEQLAKTFETLRTMHENALSTKTKLETSVANAPLDESEEWYRQAILDTIQKASNDYTDGFGLAGAAEGMNKLVADIINSKEFRGKTAANLAHKEFVKKIMEDPNLSQMEKDFYLEINPYKYNNNLTDDKGREVMYDWARDPNRVNVVYGVNMDELLKRALSNAAARHYGDSHSIFETFSGNEVEIEGFEGQQFLPVEEIVTSMKNIIDSDPNVKAGFQRKYEIGLWHDFKYEGDDWEMKTNRQIPTEKGTGLVLGYDEWLKRLLAGYASTAAYYSGYSPSQKNAIWRYQNGLLGKNSKNTETKVTSTDTNKETKKQENKIKANREKNNVITKQPKQPKQTSKTNKSNSSHTGSGRSRTQ